MAIGLNDLKKNSKNRPKKDANKDFKYPWNPPADVSPQETSKNSSLHAPHKVKTQKKDSLNSSLERLKTLPLLNYLNTTIQMNRHRWSQGKGPTLLAPWLIKTTSLPKK